MIEENKHFIFDNPISLKKYIAKKVIYSVKSVAYNCLLAAFKPKDIEKKKYYLSVCAIFRNEAKYMKEWIEFHKIIGVDHFYLYNNFSNDDFQNVLMPYIEEGLVTLMDWPIKQGQMSAYKDCAERFSFETNWIAYIDLDEFIVPNKYDDMKILLHQFEDRPVVIAYWRLFGTSGKISRDINELVIEDFFMCWRKYTNIGKYFYNTAYEYADDLPQNTAMHSRWSRYKGHKLPPVNFYNHVICSGIDMADDDYPPVQINHYFTKSYNEYLEKKSRGDAFFELNPRDEEYFNWHDMKCQGVDYNIRKYMVKLKKAMNINV